MCTFAERKQHDFLTRFLTRNSVHCYCTAEAWWRNVNPRWKEGSSKKRWVEDILYVSSSTLCWCQLCCLYYYYCESFQNDCTIKQQPNEPEREENWFVPITEPCLPPAVLRNSSVISCISCLSMQPFFMVHHSRRHTTTNSVTSGGV